MARRAGELPSGFLTPQSRCTRQVGHLAGAYPGFCCMKQIGVFLPSPDRMGYWFISRLPLALSSPVVIYTSGWRE